MRRKTFHEQKVNMTNKPEEDYLRHHLHNHRKQNDYVLGFFEGDFKEFLEE